MLHFIYAPLLSAHMVEGQGVSGTSLKDFTSPGHENFAFMTQSPLKVQPPHATPGRGFPGGI